MDKKDCKERLWTDKGRDNSVVKMGCNDIWI